jgi:hypothetical protein
MGVVTNGLLLSLIMIEQAMVSMDTGSCRVGRAFCAISRRKEKNMSVKIYKNRGELFPFTPIFRPLTLVFRPLTGFCFAKRMNDAKWFVLKKTWGR